MACASIFRDLNQLAVTAMERACLYVCFDKVMFCHRCTVEYNEACPQMSTTKQEKVFLCFRVSSYCFCSYCSAELMILFFFDSKYFISFQVNVPCPLHCTQVQRLHNTFILNYTFFLNGGLEKLRKIYKEDILFYIEKTYYTLKIFCS